MRRDDHPDAEASGESPTTAPEPASDGSLVQERTRSDPFGPLSLPVPRSVREDRGEVLPPPTARPLAHALDERTHAGGLASPDARGATRVPGAREEEATLRRTVARAARTPEELGRALGHIGAEGISDPQAGQEAGPPLPGERGYHGDD